MIIGISGKAGCGKSTLAALLISALGQDWVRMSLGSGVKKEASEVFNFPLWLAHYPEGKKCVVDVSGLGFGACHLTIREILQYWGTDVRRKEDPDYWIKKFLENIPADKHVIVDDIRFISEVNFIRNNGGKVFRIHPYDGYEKPSAGGDHLSETELDDYAGFDGEFAPIFGELSTVAGLITGIVNANLHRLQG